MDKDEYRLLSYRQRITQNNLHIKAIIQHIIGFRGSLDELEKLNAVGRSKLSELRNCIGKIDILARKSKPEVAKEVELYRQQLARTLHSFRNSSISTRSEIEKIEQQELFTNPETEMRHRNAAQHSRSSLVSQQDGVTEKMIEISRNLSDTTQKSAVTIESLVSSSDNLEGTRDELLTTAGTISQSGKLFQKYSRRECTDVILLFVAIAFFIACVLYIVKTRVL